MNTFNVAVVGLGHRGLFNMHTILKIDGVKVTALCEIYDEKIVAGENMLADLNQPKAFTTNNYLDVINREDVDVVMIFSSWESHIEIATEAMRAGKAVGMEVGGAYSIDDCWKLVRTYEETKTPFMFLENCCYNKTELMVTAMARDGLLGEIVHCHGAYAHDLRKEISTGKEKTHYRLRNYIYRNCENYPTHELGPIAKLLDINKGNRMLSLVSVASKAAGLNEYIKTNIDTLENKALLNQKFSQGDIVNTIITCANGETISLKLDTTLPRSYSREFTVRGTKGLYEENTNSVFIDGDEENFQTVEHYKKAIDNAVKYEQDYLPDYWKNITEEEIKLGHGGMDYFLFLDFFAKLGAGEAMPINVYDAAAWAAISCLSEQSIAQNGASVAIPDFTNGKWIMDNKLGI